MDRPMGYSETDIDIYRAASRGWLVGQPTPIKYSEDAREGEA